MTNLFHQWRALHGPGPRAVRSAVLVKLLLVLLLLPLAPRAEAIRFAVLHPEASGPYGAIFDAIYEGVNESIHSEAERLIIAADSDPAQVAAELNERRVNTVIALGPEGYRIARAGALPSTTTTISGAYFPPANSIPGISLAVDPHTLFERLSRLAPRVRQVHVVYDPKYNGWLIELAQQAANRFDLTLRAHPESSLRDAVTRYHKITEAGLDDTHAIWLPVDPTTVYDKVVMPMLLKAAWDEHFVLFSSKPGHARKGVLFSLFPDHKRLGRSLAKMAEGLRVAKDGKPVLQPLNDVLLAVNARTARHLGLNFNNDDKKEFNLVFPSR